MVNPILLHLHPRLRPRPTAVRPFPRRDPAALGRLKTQVAALEAGVADAAEGLPLTPPIDAHLPWGGLNTAALHEAAPRSTADAGAATGFAALLLARAAARAAPGGVVLWCLGRRVLDAGAPNVAGLARFGLDPGRVVVVAAGRPGELLWAMEEGLASHGVAAVLGEVGAVSLTESRRLQLAAEGHAKTALLLAPPCPSPAASATLTRWRIAAAPEGVAGAEGGKGLGSPRWELELFRCRGGAPGRWIVEWRDATRDLVVAAEPGDRPAVPDGARLAG